MKLYIYIYIYIYILNWGEEKALNKKINNHLDVVD